MITVALDTATDRCSVAVSNDRLVAYRYLDGARRHAASVLALLDEALDEVGASAHQIDRILTADGPGSFTGLRVSASVAKAITWRRETVWYTAPSLLLRAMAHCPPNGGTVLALSDALRGEVYAGCWRIVPEVSVSIDHGPPRAMHPEELARFGAVDALVGTVPLSLIQSVEDATRRTLIGGDAALPDASVLLALVDVPGGVTLITDPSAWEPDYGRPAEAQVVWERKHGRSLPDTPVIAR